MENNSESSDVWLHRCRVNFVKVLASLCVALCAIYMCSLFFFFFVGCTWVQRLHRGLGYAWEMRYFEHEAADENNQSISCMISYLEQRQKQNANICKWVVLKHKCFVPCSSDVNTIGNVGKPVDILAYALWEKLWSLPRWSIVVKLLNEFTANFFAPPVSDLLGKIPWLDKELFSADLIQLSQHFLLEGYVENAKYWSVCMTSYGNAEFLLPSRTCGLASCKFSSKGFALRSNYIHIMAIAFH